MSHVAPPFLPVIRDDPASGLIYEDGRVLGGIEVTRCKTTLTIHEWSSQFPGNGHTRQALEWLRAQGYADIAAYSVGLIEDGVGDISTAYWQHMHALGLVDQLIDDNGCDITPERTQANVCARSAGPAPR